METFLIALTADFLVVAEEEVPVWLVAAVQELPAQPFWCSF